MKPKAKTLIERQGFLDPDRGPNHDTIQIWVYNNIVSVLKSFSTEDKIFNVTTKKLEYPIVQNGHYKVIVGFLDLLVTGNLFDQEEKFIKSFAVAIEVKSVIPSIGDLVRQINFYRKFESLTHWIVVSPDDHFAEILKQEGILFYKYKDPNLLF